VVGEGPILSYRRVRSRTDPNTYHFSGVCSRDWSCDCYYPKLAPHSTQVIKLSDAVQPLPRQATQYVHGAPDCFLRIGDDASSLDPDGGPRFSKGAYTLGKMVWGKVQSHLSE
jgi:hypothetical protein